MNTIKNTLLGTIIIVSIYILVGGPLYYSRQNNRQETIYSLIQKNPPKNLHYDFGSCQANFGMGGL